VITFLVVGESITDNEKLVSSIIGSTELDTCAICMHSSKEVLNLVHSKKHQIDLFILSVKMKEQSGYKLAEGIRKVKEYQNTPILFITSLSYNQVGFESLSTYESYKRYNYISLPISRIDVQGKFGLYVENIIKNQTKAIKGEKVIYLKHNTGEIMVDVKDILYAEVQNKTCCIHTKTNQYIIDRCSLQQMINVIDDDNFVKCHKSFAINMKNAKGFEKYGKRIWQAVYENNRVCLISRTYIDFVLDKYKSTYQGK